MISYPDIRYSNIDLPLTNLHLLQYGDGPPLVIVPATISEINSWLNMILFMSQRYKVVFFELPGHGKSSPFKSHFSTEQVAQTVEALMDRLEIQEFSLMGFSFGGMLTIKILERMTDRVNRVLLYSPFMTYRAIKLHLSIPIIRKFFPLILRDSTQNVFISIVHNPRLLKGFLWFLKMLGVIEYPAGLYKRLIDLSPSTLETLVYQFSELLNFDSSISTKIFVQPCHFGMSTSDPLLDFTETYNTTVKTFPNITTQFYKFPFHQPPKPFSVLEYNTYFQSYLNF
jgi:pimeloyl-ACP methyl ester carboxylesterase